MAGSLIKVGPDELDAFATFIGETQYARVGEVESRVRVQSDSLVAAWTGGAGNAYREAVSAWLSRVGNVKQILADLGTKLHGTAAAMRAAEADNTATARS